MVLDRDPDADVRDLPGVAVRWVDCRFPFWNCVALTEVGVDAGVLARRLGEAAEVMRGKENPGFLWVFEDLLDEGARAGLTAAAGRAGLERAFPGTGMAVEPLRLAEPSHPDLRFTRVTTDALLTAYADINSRAYDLELADGRDGLGGSALWKSGVFAFLGFRGETPVTCAAAVEAEGRLFVLMVATLPEWERRGYGEAVTRRALYEGVRVTGLTRATLHATAAGAPVYPRIGFRPNSPISFFRWAG
ncbi:GNAT family N-acetyltransferase [Streptomyces sp. AJS327]|uniref:GNAT family N-acetyltransferase n=1 Tax=Streptomyces sp. AJS327 TaxID=2545265 RepID=UPI0015DE1B91|nr:GNAT family N-acetyltransferase [Streptomyces sp. AJS327]